MGESETRSVPTEPPAEPRAAAPDADWTALAASLAAQKGGRPAPADAAASQPTAPSRGVQRAVFTSSLALMLGLVSITVAGMLWWQYRSFYVSLDQTDNVTAASLGACAPGSALRTPSRTRRTMSRRCASERERHGARRRAAEPVSPISAAARRAVRAARSTRTTSCAPKPSTYLNVANTELALTADWDNAITALSELADGRLAELARPAARARARSDRRRAARGAPCPAGRRRARVSAGRLAACADDLPLRADLRRLASGSGRAARRRGARLRPDGWLALSARCSASCGGAPRHASRARLSAAERRRPPPAQLELAVWRNGRAADPAAGGRHIGAAIDCCSARLRRGGGRGRRARAAQKRCATSMSSRTVPTSAAR
jgi:hypothetical protein